MSGEEGLSVGGQLTFEHLEGARAHPYQGLGPATVVLRGFALPYFDAVFADLARIVERAPFRHLVTPGGFRMSVAMTNCGSLGWVSDRKGYRYAETDPENGHVWPALPPSFLGLAARAASAAGFEGFIPDACLINRYEPSARLTLHQDKNERDLEAPVVSVSFGIPATFLFGGFTRSEKQQRVSLAHGDVVVWGGPDRLRYHGVLPLRNLVHPVLGAHRINLTFRKAG